MSNAISRIWRGPGPPETIKFLAEANDRPSPLIGLREQLLREREERRARPEEGLHL